MSPQAFAIFIAGTLLVAVLGLGLLGLLLLNARGAARLQQRLHGTAIDLGDEFETDAAGAPLLTTMARRGRALEKLVDTEGESGRLLVQAGWRSTTSRAFWYAFQSALPVAGLVAVMAFWTFGPDKNKGVLLAALVFVVFALSFLIPRWVLRAVAEGRRTRIKAEVPLFIHLLVLVFEAGLSTRQAIASMVREGGGVLPELGKEFDVALRQLEAGGDTTEVLRNLGAQMDVADLTSVLAVLRQVDRYGGEIREPLLEALALLEERRSLDLREKVNRLSGKMTVVMVLFFFPALLVFVAGPAFVAIIKALGEATAR